MSYRRNAMRCLSRANKAIVSIDLYGTDFKLGVKEGQDQLKTLSGSILSLVSLMALIMYGASKYLILTGK